MNEQKKGWLRRHPLLTTALTGFALIIVVGSTGGPNESEQPTAAATAATPAAPAPPPAPIAVTAKQLGDAFAANQVAAEKKWGGKHVQFTATISNINSSSVSFHNVTTKFSFTQISCRIADESQVLDLVKGSKVTVRGVVGGDQVLGVISLDDCEVVR